MLVLAPWLSAGGLLGSGPLAREGIGLQLALLALAFVGVGVVELARRHPTTRVLSADGGLQNIAGGWLVIAYAGFLFGFFPMLRCDIDAPGQHGPWMLLIIIVVCKFSDIGAYFVGSAFGRTKLLPHVSPAKSVEGTIGGLVASVTVSLLLFSLHQRTIPTDNPLQGGTAEAAALWHDVTRLFHHLDYAQAIVFGLVVSISGQIGDLIESVFKRSAGAKDSANVLPAFGGILDLVDSPLIATPVAWILLTRVWKVV
jgi:phosphatidate cytidylyltransferase